MSDFGLASIHTVPGRCSHSPTLPSRLPRQQPDSDADRAMEYLSLKARQLPARALDHAQPCPSFWWALADANELARDLVWLTVRQGQWQNCLTAAV